MHYSVVDDQRCEVKCKYIVQEVNLRILRADHTIACKQSVLFSALRFHFVVTARGLVQWWAFVSADFIGYKSVWSSVMKVCLSVHQCHSRFNEREKNMKKQKNHSSKDSSFALLWDIPFENIVSLPLKCKWGLLHALSPPSLLCWLSSSAVRFIVAKKHTSRILDNSPSVKEFEQSKKHERSTRRPQSKGEW